MKHMLINKQYLSLILVLILSLSALLAQANPMATKVTFNADDATLLRDMVRRDDIVLRLEESTISLHPDHKAVSSPTEDTAPDDEPIEEPMRLYRLHNLCRLALEVMRDA